MKKSKRKNIAPFESENNLKPKILVEGVEIGKNQLGILMENKKSKKFLIFFNIFIKYFSIFLCCILLFNAKVAGTIAPFAFGFVFALLLLDEKPYFVGPIFVVAGLIVNFSVATLVSVCCMFCSMLLLGFFNLVLKKKIPIYIFPAFLVLGLVGYVYFHIGTQTQILQTCAFSIVAVLFFFICVGFLRAVKKRGIQNGLTLDETICFSIFLMALVLGLFDVYVWKFSLATILVCFLMLVISKLLGKMPALFFCAIAGFGLAFANNSLNSLAIFCSWALVVLALGNVNRYAVAIGVLVMDFLLGAYFHGYPVYTWVQLVDVLLPGVVFCVIPNKVFEKFGNVVDFSKTSGGLMFLDLDRQKLKNKILNVSKIFENMGETYKRIGQAEHWKSEPKQQVANEVLTRLCSNCENYAQCMREHNMYEDIEKLARAGIEKQKASVLDVSKKITMHCNKTSSLLSCVNFASGKIAESEKLLESEDGGRIAIGEQLLGTSKILRQVAADFDGGAAQNKKVSDDLFEELLACDVVAKDILVVERQAGLVVTMIVKQSEDEKTITGVLNKFFGIVFSCKTNLCKYAGCKLLEFVPQNTFDISVGVSTLAKNNGIESGDVFAFVELDSNKVLIALCDGMGTGSEARSASEEVVSLVENFYRAGFDSDLILKNISRLLATSGREVFSTLDVCVFDKSNGNVDFVKASSPPTLVKSGHLTCAIETQSLPIGIVEGELQHKSMKLLQKGDVVVLASDGVFDSFANLEEFSNVVNNQAVVNMNLLCENILEEAKARGGEGKDDMTVIAFRVV